MSYGKIDPLGTHLDGLASIGASVSVSAGLDTVKKVSGGGNVKAAEILALAAAGSAAVPVVGAVGSAVLGLGAAVAALVDNYGKDIENLFNSVKEDAEDFLRCGFDGACYAKLDRNRKRDKKKAETMRKAVKELRDTAKKAQGGDIKAGARLEIAVGLGLSNLAKMLSGRNAAEAAVKTAKALANKSLEKSANDALSKAKKAYDMLMSDYKSGKRKPPADDSGKAILSGWLTARENWAKYEKEYDAQLKAKGAKQVAKVKADEKATKKVTPKIKGSLVPLNRVRGPVVGAFAKTDGVSKEGQEGFLVEKDGKVTKGRYV